MPWMLMEWVPGLSLRQLNSVKERYLAAKVAGNLLRKIHRVSTDGFGWPTSHGGWVGNTAAWSLQFYVRRAVRNIVPRGNLFPPGELEEAFSLSALALELLDFGQPRLLHGDMTGGNVVVKSNYRALENAIVFIDPGELISGDPMSDIGYSQTTRLRLEFRRGVLDGYTSSDPLSPCEYDRFLRWRLLRQCVVASCFTKESRVWRSSSLSQIRAFARDVTTNATADLAARRYGYR